MTAMAEQRPWTSPPVRLAVETGVDDESPVTIDSESLQKAWDAIERKLIHWGSDPHELDEEGTITPTGKTISRAIQLAAVFSRQGLPAPNRVIPDAYGAIVFELSKNNEFMSIHVQPDNVVEFRVFRDHRLLRRDVFR